MIITIDGLTATGKSTVAQVIAKKLNIFYLNSGFLYRALGYILLHENYSLEDINNLSEQELAKFINNKNFKYIYDSNSAENKINIFYNNQNLTKFLKTP